MAYYGRYVDDFYIVDTDRKMSGRDGAADSLGVCFHWFEPEPQ